MLLPSLVLGLSLAAANPWAQLAEQDLKAMRQTLLEDHPGPVDSQNPGFKQWLEGGYREALAKARKARSFGGYAYALRYYAAGFRDGHLRAVPLLDPQQTSWPGFVLSLRQGRYVVTVVDKHDAEPASLPAVGSELLDCDGRTPKQMLEQDVLPFGAGADREALVDARHENHPKARSVHVEWRASSGNLRHMEEMVQVIGRNFGEGSTQQQWAREVVQGMTEARRRGQPLWSDRKEATAEPPAPSPATEPPNPVRARAYLLTDGRCGSACLDFADLMLSLPGVTHVGLPTSADSVYMDVRSVPLPGGAARLVVPTKVYRNRVRGHNEPYVPARRFDGDIGDTAAVERWLLEQVAIR